MKKFYFILGCVILISFACIFDPLRIIEGHGGGGGRGFGGRGFGRGRGFSYYAGPSYYGYGGGYHEIPVYYPPSEYYYYSV